MTEPRYTNRRTVLRTMGLGIAAAGAFASPAAAGDDVFARQLDTVRSATRKYRDVATARADGYVEPEFSPFPPVGHVFINTENIGNVGHDQPPSVLFYAPNGSSGETDDSDLILAGIEYHVLGRDAGDQDIFADEEASRKLAVTEADGWHPNPLGADITGLHVWVHLPNPAGVFNVEHPTIARLVEGTDGG